MKLTQIEIKKDKMRATMEENIDGSYGIRIEGIDDKGRYDNTIANFRTNEISIDDVMEILTFFKNYNFIL